MKILVIVAHPDDEVLGVGGTMLKHVEKGDHVRVVYMATGIAARRSSGYKNAAVYKNSKSELQKMRKEIHIIRNDAKKACSILKVNDIRFHEFPDNEMDSLPLLKIVKAIEDEINDINPDRIYTHHYGDLNVDHRTVYNATLTACRPINSSLKDLICFEVASSTEWNYPPSFRPNYFVNINNQLESKIKAMEAYKNEVRKFPHPRSSENLRMIAGRWGSVSGQKSAEAFEIIRRIER